MGLSEERKKQIRAEEEAAFHAEQEAEQQYREQVRQELEEQQLRDSIRSELAGAAPAPSAKASPAPRRSTSRPFPRRAIAAAVALGGLICIGLAFNRGFALPFTGPPKEITLEATTSGEMETVGRVPSEDPTVSAETTGRTTKAHSATPSGESKPASGKPSKRATLRGTGISVEVPSGWRVEPSDFDEALEIRWRGTGVSSGHEEVAAYLLLQRTDVRRGEAVEDFAERLVEEFMSSTTPDQKVTLDGDDAIKNFHGVPAVSIDIASGGYLPYRMRNTYWVKDGRGYILTCYATAGSFEDRAPAFSRMIDSIRMKPEAE